MKRVALSAVIFSLFAAGCAITPLPQGTRQAPVVVYQQQGALPPPPPPPVYYYYTPAPVVIYYPWFCFTCGRHHHR